jgi:hypothetical protein
MLSPAPSTGMHPTVESCKGVVLKGQRPVAGKTADRCAATNQAGRSETLGGPAQQSLLWHGVLQNATAENREAPGRR